MRPNAALAAGLLLLVLPAALGLYADQRGSVQDWLKQHVGRVSAARLSPGPRPALVVASAAASTLAALDAADGSLRWRKVLAEGDAVTALEVAGGTVVSLSGGGRQVLAWDAASGAALWSAALPAPAAGPGGDLLVLPDGEDAVLASFEGGVKAFALADGSLLWTAELPGAAARLYARADGGAWAATVQGSSLTAVQLAADGQAVQRLSLSGSEPLSASQVVLADGAVAALSSSSNSVCAAELADGASRLACTRLASLLPAGASVDGAQLLPGRCASQAVLQLSSGAAVLALSSSGAKLVKHAPGAAASGCFAAAGGPAVALATPSAAGLEVQTLSAADGAAVQPAAVVAGLAPQRVGGALVPAAALFAGGSGQQLVVFSDDSLALVAGGRQAWLRHEELASVQDVLFADLPAPTPENEAAWAASQPGPREALAAQLLQLKVQASQLAPGLASPEEVARLEAHKQLTSDKLRPTRDPDGFRKQVLVLTAGGKLTALHNGDGRALWSLDWGPGAGLRRLALWRVPHDVQHAVEVVVFALGPEGTTAHIINAHTGTILQTLSAGAGPAAELLRLPQPVHDGTADQHVFVVVPAAAGAPARVLPDAAEARAAFQAARPSLAFWRADHEAGSVRGFGFTAEGVVEERWSAALAPPGGPARLLAVAGHPPGEAVFSPARVLGSGELKMKYLNPNTLLVLAGPPAGTPGGGRLTATLLDGVSGRVLFSQVHEGAAGPAHGVLSENTAAYHFWSAEQHRWQMGSVELFDASPTTLRVADLAFGESNTSSSSWDAPPVEAAAQTFLSRLPVRGLAVTRSARGNTAKQVVMLTPSGRAYLLDRRFLDPRRPIIAPGAKPTPAQAAEALPPYAPELPLAGQQYATLDHQVARLRGCTLEAAVLESTQLLLAHGLDLFHTRLTPSRTFDMVPDDFPYALLVLIVVGMAAATAVLSRLQTRAAVKAKWA